MKISTRPYIGNLHLFSAVNPDLESAAREIPIDLDVRERPQCEISLGGGYSTQDDFGGQVQWNDYNWFSGGRRMSVVLRYASINSYASASLRQPYFLDRRDLEVGVTAALQQEDEQTFTLHSEAILPQLTWHITEQLNGTIGYRLMYANLNNVSSTVIDALFVIAIIAAAVVTNTNWFRDLARNKMNAILTGTFKGQLTIGRIEGSIWSNLTLDDITLTYNGDRIAHIEQRATFLPA